MRLSTKKQAQIEAASGTHGTSGGADNGDIMIKTFVKPDKPVERSMQTVQSRLKLTVKDGHMPDLPSAGAQRFEKDADEKSAVLNIDIDDNIPASDAEKANADYLGDSAMVDDRDPRVIKLAEQGVKHTGTNPMDRAEALRTFVHRYIDKKGMATAFASASETAITKTGDCSEHGVLLCALLRANGIPARVATGLIYADSFMGQDGIFGWHMWTQALIEGHWVVFDATLPRRFNAMHILTATSSLNDGLGSADLTSMLQLIGNLDIKVLDVRYDHRDSAGDAVHE